MKNISKSTNNEAERLEALFKFKILDTPQEEDFDSITKLASYICNTPIALISLIDGTRQWFKSRVGLEVSETPREISFCQYAIKEDKIFEIPNALLDDRFVNNSLVTGSPDIRFYAGTPLKSSDGFNIGTLCVIDRVPRDLTSDQKEGLETLGKQVIAQLELRQKNHELNIQIKKLALENLEKLEVQDKLNIKYNELENANIAIKAADTFFSMSEDLLFIATGKYFTKINPAFTKLLGFDIKFLLENPFMSFVHPEDIHAANGELLKIREGFTINHFIARFRCKDNSYLWIDWGVTPDIQTGLLYGVARNVTERINNEDELIKAKELAEKLAIVKDQFLANMSHEIRTPLNAVIGFTDLLAQTNLDKTQLDYIDNVQIAGENLLLIINDILDLSKMESGNLQIEKQPFNLQKTLKHVYNLLKEKVSKEIEFKLFLDTNLPEVVIGDKGRLNQILINLTGNAIKFTEKGEVTISVKKIKENQNQYSLRFSVKDTGIGIPEEKLKTIFERFTQAEDSTTRRFGGTGLGLNIVKQLVELQNAKINVVSGINRGSEFYFIINYEKATYKEAETINIVENNLGNLKILLCEDNVLNQKLTKIVVNKFGFDLDIAENGAIGIDLVSENKYDLILMDLQMPVKDGYQTTLHIRNKMKLNIPIIAMTAHSLVGEQDRCFKFGMNAYLPKPFRQEELLQAIKSVLSNKNEKTVKNKKVNMSILEGMSDKNSVFKKEMAKLFTENIPNEVAEIEEAINKNQFQLVKNLSHKLKSSLSIFKLNDLLKCLIIFESDADLGKFSNETEKNIITLKNGVQDVVENLEKTLL